MVSFTALVSAVSMALFATTINAAPAIKVERDWPPSTSSVLDFTLYKETSPGNEGECWNNIPSGDIHVAPGDLISSAGDPYKSTVCNKADFYVAHIDSTHPGYNCNVYVFDDDSCSNNIGWYGPSSPCENYYTSYGRAEFKSWKVSCT